MIYKLEEKHIEFRHRLVHWLKENILTSTNLSLDILDNLKADNLFGFHAPKVNGHHGRDFIFHTIALEEIAKIDIKFAYNFVSNYFVIRSLMDYATPEQSIQYLLPLDRGDKIATFTFREISEKYTFTNTNARAEKSDDGYILNGKKVSSYNFLNSDFFLVTVATNKEDDLDGLSIFILDKNTEGLTYQRMADGFYRIIMDEVKVSKDQLLGEENKGYTIVLNTLMNCHLSLASVLLGANVMLFDQLIKNLKACESYHDEFTFMNDFTKIATSMEVSKTAIYSCAELMSIGKDERLHMSYCKKFVDDMVYDLIAMNYKVSNELGIDATPLRQKTNTLLRNIFLLNLENTEQIISNRLLNIVGKKETLLETRVHIQDNHKNRKNIIFDKANQETIKQFAELLVNSLKDSNSSVDIFDDIEKADRLVCFGLGIEDRENISLVEELSRELGAVVGCTLPISEELEWYPSDHFVGEMGQVFSGKFMISIGASGTSAHLNGFRNSDLIFAINNDKHANIFNNCDYGLVGDLLNIVPKLLEEIKYINNK